MAENAPTEARKRTLAGAVCALMLCSGCEVLVGMEDGKLGDPFGGGGTGAAAGGAAAGGAGAAGGGTSGGGGAGGAVSRYVAEVMADEPAGYFRLGESVTPTAFDTSGNGHEGTYQAVTVGEPGAIAGDPDTAVHFSGMNGSIVQFEDIFDFPGKTPFTAEVWIKPEIEQCSVLGKVDWNDVEMRYDGWFFNINSTSSGVRRGMNFVAPIAPVGEWTYLAFAYDGVTATLYHNGVEAESRVPDDSVDHDVGFTIGRVENWAQFVGTIDEVAVYDKYLTAARIKAHYDAGVGN